MAIMILVSIILAAGILLGLTLIRVIERKER